MTTEVTEIKVEKLTNAYVHQIQKLMDQENIIPSEINALIMLFYPILVWMVSHHQFIEIKSETIPTIIQGKFRHSHGYYIDKAVNCANIIMNSFFHAKNQEIITIEIETTQTIKDFHGVGFCTKEFNQWTQRIWNSGGNHSIILYQHGWLPRSKEFTVQNGEQNNTGWFTSIWNPGDTIIVEMNMDKKTGKIWNKANPKIELCIGLPDECTFLLMMGNQNQVITIKDIQIARG